MLIWTSRNIPNVGLFSAYAEVFLDQLALGGCYAAFLCLRRGVSMTELDERRKLAFSLPTQRCFLRTQCLQAVPPLFSAYAEVFPALAKYGLLLSPFLCLRRGVSSKSHVPQEVADFSLPTQRCFRDSLRQTGGDYLFSAYAEVFLRCAQVESCGSAFLCLRRGVSFDRTR